MQYGRMDGYGQGAETNKMIDDIKNNAMNYGQILRIPSSSSSTSFSSWPSSLSSIIWLTEM